MLNHVDQIAFAAFHNQLAELKTVKKVVVRLKKIELDALEKKRLCIKDRVEKLRTKIIRAETDYMHICKAKYEVENPDSVVPDAKPKSSGNGEKKRKAKKPKSTNTDDEMASGVENDTTDDEKVEKKPVKKQKREAESNDTDEESEKKDKKKKKTSTEKTSGEKKKKQTTTTEVDSDDSLQKKLDEAIDTLDSDDLELGKTEGKNKATKTPKKAEEEEEEEDD